MATWELQLISRIIRSGDLNSPLQWGITESDFLTGEGRGLFSNLMGYFSAPATRGSIPGPSAIQQYYPHFQLCDDPSMTTEALCTEVRKQRLSVELQTKIQQAAELAKYDPLDAIAKLQVGVTDLQNLGYSKQTDVHFADAWSRALHRMQLIEQGVDLSCGQWPWEPLQEATGGLQPDDYVIFYGRPKSFKSWCLAYLLSWFFDCGKRVLVYTKEMTADNIWMRAGACLASVRYHHFRRGRLSPDERRSVFEMEARLHQARLNDMAICLNAKDAGGLDTVPWLRSKVEQYQPDVTFVDGLYLMTDVKGAKKDNERVRNISRDLRQMILDTGRPVIATVQANRAAAKNNDANLDEVAFSDGLSQDSTIICRTIKEKDKNTILMVMGGSREFSLAGFRIYGIPALNFEYAGPITMKEILQAVEKDIDEAAPPPSSTSNGKKKAARPATEATATNLAIRKFNKQVGA